LDALIVVDEGIMHPREDVIEGFLVISEGVNQDAQDGGVVV